MDCPICLKHINDIELSITNCNHNFCYTCLNNWFQKNKKTCPMCRENIDFFKYNNEINRIIYVNSNNNQRSNTPTTNTNNYVVVDKNKFMLLKAISTTSIIFIGSTIYLLIEGNFFE
tara:strand:- start:336 stop:686 length:351 start_codon:yes stop_codon:yes gene_type:complete